MQRPTGPMRGPDVVVVGDETVQLDWSSATVAHTSWRSRNFLSGCQVLPKTTMGQDERVGPKPPEHLHSGGVD